MEKTSLLVACASVIGAFAAPTYYTFTGKILMVPQDQGGYAAAHNIKVGSDVAYFFAVDTSEQGFTQASGVKTAKTDVSNPGAGQNYFYDSLIASSLFSPAVTMPSDGSYFGYRSILASGTSTLYSVNFQVIIGDNASQTQVLIHIPDTSANDWLPKVNGSYTATESYTAGSANSSMVSAFVTCTAISSTRPSGLARPSPGPAKAWLQAGIRDGELALESRSGIGSEIRILDANGKIESSFPLNQTARIPASGLPRGLFLLQARSPGQSAVTLPFAR